MEPVLSPRVQWHAQNSVFSLFLSSPAIHEHWCDHTTSVFRKRIVLFLKSLPDLSLSNSKTSLPLTKCLWNGKNMCMVEFGFHATSRNLFFGLMQESITGWLLTSLFFCSEWKRDVHWGRSLLPDDTVWVIYYPFFELICQHTQNSALWAVRVSNREWHGFMWITLSAQSKWLIRILG